MTVEQEREIMDMLSRLTPDQIEQLTVLSETLLYDRARAHQILVNAGRRGLPEFEVP